MGMVSDIANPNPSRAAPLILSHFSLKADEGKKPAVGGSSLEQEMDRR
jgi:hypothetical protein